MNSQSSADESQHLVAISMLEKMQEMPRILHTSAGQISCCIFRAPQSLVSINLKAYEPHIVSIGPYHHGKHQLQMIQEHKWRFLRNHLSRPRNSDRSLDDYLQAIGSLEKRARQSYSGHISLDRDKFIEMLVLDGCFIIEILLITGGVVPPVDDKDPIFTMTWILPFLLRDLIIPFFVLQHLFNLSAQKDDPLLSFLVLEFFNTLMQRPVEVIQRYANLDAFHLLDIFRKSLIPDEKTPPKTAKSSSSPNMIHCATKLYQNGIKFKVGKSDSILDINFRNGVIEIPTITIDDFVTAALLNCIAFEQCHGSEITHINAYALFLGALIHTAKDVGLLRDNDVVENYYGTDEEVARFFNDLGKDIAIDLETSYLSRLFIEVNLYYKNTWYVQLATFKHNYVDTPWKFLSALAALILLTLTTVQTFFAVFGYFRPPL
ncbi:hypothetical protein ACHQM5_021258 [Ranunculus cassubicifolius]